MAEEMVALPPVSSQTEGEMYLLTFPSGKRYVGITSASAQERFARHVTFAAAGKRLCAVHQAILKYGAQAVVVETLARAPWCDLVKMERDAIARLRTKFPHGYNLTDGGEGTLGSVRSPESRERMSAIKKAAGVKLSQDHIAKLKGINATRVRSVEERAKLSASLKGRIRSAEHSANLGRANKGRTLSAEARAKLSAINKGKTFSEETRARISNAKKGVKRSAEVCQQMSAARSGKALSAVALAAHRAAHLGRVASEETRAKMSAAHRGRKQDPEAVAKRAAANLGKKRSPEARANMSAGHQAKRRDVTQALAERG